MKVGNLVKLRGSKTKEYGIILAKEKSLGWLDIQVHVYFFVERKIWTYSVKNLEVVSEVI